MTEIDFSYELPYSEGMELTREMDVPVSAAVIIVNGSGGLASRAIVWPRQDDRHPNGMVASYMAGPLAAGTPLTLRLVRQTNVGTAMGGSAAPSATGRIPPPTAASDRGRDRWRGVGCSRLRCPPVVAQVSYHPCRKTSRRPRCSRS